jgi:hypothetical protein
MTMSTSTWRWRANRLRKLGIVLYGSTRFKIFIPRPQFKLHGSGVSPPWSAPHGPTGSHTSTRPASDGFFAQDERPLGRRPVRYWLTGSVRPDDQRARHGATRTAHGRNGDVSVRIDAATHPDETCLLTVRCPHVVGRPRGGTPRPGGEQSRPNRPPCTCPRTTMYARTTPAGGIRPCGPVASVRRWRIDSQCPGAGLRADRIDHAVVG